MRPSHRCSYGLLNATEDFLAQKPDVAQKVVNAYERARAWVQENPDAAVQTRATAASITPEIARQQLLTRTRLDIDPAPGEPQRAVLARLLPLLVTNGLVRSQEEAEAAARHALRAAVRRIGARHHLGRIVTLTESDTRPAEPATTAARHLGGRARGLAGSLLLGLVVPVLFVLAWHALATSGEFSPSQLPIPGAVVAALVELLRRGELWLHIAISTQRVLLGFAFGAGAGLVFGGFVGLSRRARTVLAPSIQAVCAVPSLVWVPLLLLWLGIGETPKIPLAAIGAFFPCTPPSPRRSPTSTATSSRSDMPEGR